MISHSLFSFSQKPDSIRMEQDSAHKAHIDSIRNETEKLKKNHWRIGNYTNVFKEETGEKYVYGGALGKFSNSATTDSNLFVQVIFDNDGVGFIFKEYMRIEKKGDGDMIFSFKGDDGEVLSANFYNSSNGRIYTSERKKRNKQIFDFIISKKEIKVYAKGHGEYYFNIDTKYLKEKLVEAGLIEQ